MKVCQIALAVVFAHGAAAAAVKRKGFGPQSCVGVTRSSAGSCVLATDCEGFDLSKTEFAFDCVGQQGIVRHSFGIGGFEASEEFDTEVKCDRCETGSAEDVIVKKPVEQVAPPAPKPKAKHDVQVEVPQKLPAGAVVFQAKRRAGKGGGGAAAGGDGEEEPKAEAKVEVKTKEEKVEVKAEGPKVEVPKAEVPKAEEKGTSWWPLPNLLKPAKKEPEVVRYGPNGCVSTWQSSDGHCIMETSCKKADISQYEFGLVCVDKVGSPVRHLFGKDSFDKEETFDTLIKCDKCLGLEDIPDAVALNGEVVTMSKDISNLKAVMKNISINVQMLNEEVFKSAAPAPGPAAAAPAPAKAKPALVHHSSEVRTVAGNLRHSHKKHHHRQEDDEEDEDEDDRDERPSDVQAAVVNDDEDDDDGDADNED